jgi:hypothetical protein
MNPNPPFYEVEVERAMDKWSGELGTRLPIVLVTGVAKFVGHHDGIAVLVDELDPVSKCSALGGGLMKE